MDQTRPQVAGLGVLVTGAGGFIGARVTHDLATAGAKVTRLLRSPAPRGTPPASGSHQADLLTADLEALLATIAPQVILHCAGLTQAPETDAGRDALFAANLTATERLLRAARRMTHPPRLVLVSSAAIYAPMRDGQTAIDENHPMRPVAVYGVSKAAATMLALAEAERHSLDLAVAVPFNVIGPGQPAHMVPQVFIDHLRHDPASFALPSAEVIRDWIDVQDVSGALIALARPEGPRGLFNVSTGTGRSLRDLALRLCRIGGWTASSRAQAAAATGVTKSVGDPGRLSAALGWQARRSLDDSLRSMIEARRQGSDTG